MASNFEFLNKYWPVLYQIGNIAETYVYTDPNSCMIKLGMFGERLIDEIFAFENLPTPDDNTQAGKIQLLKRENMLPVKIDDILYALRKNRNAAVHEGMSDPNRAKVLLQMAYRLACWFMEVYGDWAFVPQPYSEPEAPDTTDWAARYAASQSALEQKQDLLASQQEKLKTQAIELHTQEEQLQMQKAALDAQEKQIAALLSQVQAVKTAASSATKEERKAQGETQSSASEMTEAETRLIIDEQLRDAGWEADTNKLRYGKGTRPIKGHNMAIAEWSTGAYNDASKGRADYALFIGLQLVGIVEAKSIHKDISAIIDNQCKEYATHILPEHEQYCVGAWGNFQVPFLFAANGRDYLKQLETKSGIWFRDARKPSNIARALQGWPSPEGIDIMLHSNHDIADEKLENMPLDLLTDPDGLNLRKYQVKAIKAAETAIIHGQRNILLSMATGTGKTRTILGMVYRFLYTNRFHRILFLVDRNSLGQQAQDVFKEVKVAELMTLDNLYNIKDLGEKNIDKETRIQIATVQSMVRRLLAYDEDGKRPTVTDYDLIIVDEAHRGYTLDKEMSEYELLYRDQKDYMSKYRMVIDYFDAVKIALTATPALHTTQIFGKPVFTYSYREAVIDGYLVDHDAPHNIMTKLRQEGIKYRQGQRQIMIDPYTGELKNGEELEDDIVYDVDTFNKKVITLNFNKTVLEEICKDLDPYGDGKTLIYAVDDAHADMIVNILHEIFARNNVPAEAIRKITGSIGDQEAVQKAIREFKNERFPNIVVTVDLLTTGIDVPEITTLVFIRRIRSRILFEQMLGRATRLCPRINKTHFEIYDAVGVYESLTDLTNMKPVTVVATFKQLIEGLETVTDPEEVKVHVERIIAKLHRKSHRVSDAAKEMFIHMVGTDLKNYGNLLHSVSTEEAKANILTEKHKEALLMLDDDVVHKRPEKIYDTHEDELISHTRGYGKGQAPKDYIESFKTFIEQNMNEIEALQIVCTRPTALTREDLKALRLELAKHQFDEKQLNSAWHEMTNQEITADIIAFIRQQAIGSPLISHEQRIKHAFARVKQEHSFNATQRGWLDRIEKTMLQETVLDKGILNEGAFRRDGGFASIDKRFGGGLSTILDEVNTYFYDERSIAQ